MIHAHGDYATRTCSWLPRSSLQPLRARAESGSTLRILELKVPPVAVFIAAAVAMWALRRVDFADFELTGSRYAAAILFVTGLVIAVRGVLAFRWHGTTVDPVTPGKASTIVRSDVYRFTRNPMYLGLALALLSFGLLLGNALSIAVVALFVGYLTRFQIIPEERVLAGKFGRAYDDYRAVVRRWL